MVIDFHTHIFPPRIAGAAINSLESTSGFKAYADATLDGLMESMKYGGVDISVVLPVVTNTRQVYAVNDYIISLKDTDKLICFGGIHPCMTDYKSEIKRIKAAGLRGIKMHPDFVRTFADDNKMADVINAATQEGLPVILHGGADASFQDYVRCTPDMIARLLPKIPDAKLICAHLCGYTYFDRLLLHMDEFIKFGLYFDVATVLRIPKKRELSQILSHCDPSHILFGTDFPWENPKTELEALDALDISEQYKENIKWKNAAKLLEINL